MKQTSLINMFQDAFRKGIRHPKYRWAIILGSFFYLVSPLDISPDVFPIIGWLDDGVLATLLISEVCQLMLDGKKNRNRAEPFETANTINIEAEPVV